MFLSDLKWVAANRYAALKKQLAEREWEDVNEYADAKTKFIRGIENRAKEQAAT